MKVAARLNGAVCLMAAMVSLSPATARRSPVAPFPDAGVVALRTVDASLAGKQLLSDPGFESAGAWQPDGAGFKRVSAPTRHGASAIRCENTDASKGAGAGQTAVLDQKAAAPILAEAWSRSENVSGSPDSDYSLYLDITFQDGTNQWGQVAAFGTGTHGWQRRQVMLFPARPIRSVRVSLLLRHHTGLVWFDDASLRELSPRGNIGIFDGVAIERRDGAPAAPVTSVLWVGANGCQLALNRADGRPVGCSSGGRSIPVLSSAASGLLVRDAGAGTAFYAFRPKLEPGLGRMRQSGVIRALGLRVSLLYAVVNGGVSISGRVDDTTGRDRAVTVCFVLPVAPGGATWWDTLRQSRPVGTSVDTNTVHVGAGASGEMSRYPLACLEFPDAALNLAVPMDLPRVIRLAYDPVGRRYYGALDLGLARGAPGGSFRFVLYGTPPGDGMRGALAA
ncbi:MAG: hypothetical protein LC772_09755, partial [Chloroflexi bacterium]|nr:hypothetical protein [Chloroflexota bacterium]